MNHDDVDTCSSLGQLPTRHPPPRSPNPISWVGGEAGVSGFVRGQHVQESGDAVPSTQTRIALETEGLPYADEAVGRLVVIIVIHPH